MCQLKWLVWILLMVIRGLETGNRDDELAKARVRLRNALAGDERLHLHPIYDDGQNNLDIRESSLAKPYNEEEKIIPFVPGNNEKERKTEEERNWLFKTRTLKNTKSNVPEENEKSQFVVQDKLPMSNIKQTFITFKPLPYDNDMSKKLPLMRVLPSKQDLFYDKTKMETDEVNEKKQFVLKTNNSMMLARPEYHKLTTAQSTTDPSKKVLPESYSSKQNDSVLSFRRLLRYTFPPLPSLSAAHDSSSQSNLLISQNPQDPDISQISFEFNDETITPLPINTFLDLNKSQMKTRPQEVERKRVVMRTQGSKKRMGVGIPMERYHSAEHSKSRVYGQSRNDGIILNIRKLNLMNEPANPKTCFCNRRNYTNGIYPSRFSEEPIQEVCNSNQADLDDSIYTGGDTFKSNNIEPFDDFVYEYGEPQITNRYYNETDFHKDNISSYDDFSQIESDLRYIMPYVVVLLRYEIIKCGGTLLSDRHVLTAAHCFTQGTALESPSIFSIRAGSLSWRKGGQWVQVNNFRVHPEFLKFKNSPFSYLHDLALVMLKKALVLGDTVEFIDVAQPSIKGEILAATVRRDNCRTVSFRGLNAFPSLFPYKDVALHETWTSVLPLIESEDCKHLLLQKDLMLDSETQICTICPEGICSGEEGAGLICRIQDSEMLVGVLSFGTGCGPSCSPSVYTRTDTGRTFIMDSMRILTDVTTRGSNFRTAATTALILASVLLTL